MKLCRFLTPQGTVSPGVTLDGVTVLELAVYGVQTLREVLELEDPLRYLESLAEHTGRAHRLADVRLLAPVELQEIWAAGVTYERSRAARTQESQNAATVYDRVYEAERPELFFKSLAEKVVDPGQAIGIRRDARNSVPEPELALVINCRGRIVGHTLGNDVTARDLEGDNPLYLPQAKIYDRSCAVGPWVRIGATENEVRAWSIRSAVHRSGRVVFSGEAPIRSVHRSFSDLVAFLHRSQVFPHGAVLLTGTGIVPPPDFSLQPGDRVRVEIPEIGLLENPVIQV